MGDRGDFFAVDRRVWKRICDHGRMNWAVAYLVLARGSGGDQRTTAWSTNSIEKYTGISRPNAKAAVHGLLEAGFVERTRDGTRPLYVIRSAEEVGGTSRLRPPTLTPIEAGVLEVIRRHPGGVFVPRTRGRRSGWPEGAPISTAARLYRLGLVRLIKSQTYAAAPEIQPTPERVADWIWLPNTLVDGIAGEASPVERVRGSQNVGALRLLVDLYHAQALSSVGGVHWWLIRENYERVKIGERGQFDVYAFTRRRPAVQTKANFASPLMGEATAPDGSESEPSEPNWSAFFGPLDILLRTKVAEFVPHLVEADGPETEVLFPVPRGGEGEEVERAVGEAAHRAGLALIRPGTAVPEGARLVPVLRHYQAATVVGLLRLKHRARTSATAAWRARTGEWEEKASLYQEVERAATAARGLQHQGEIKGTSKGDQR